jgi:histidinol-phosphate aminotransferase
MSEPPFRFDAAINPYGCAPSVIAAIKAAADPRHLRHYGDADGAALRARLAAHFDLTADHFVVYNGCGEAFVWLCLGRLLLPRRAMVCPHPSYERFVEVGRRCAAKLVQVPLQPDTWALPVDALVDAARAHSAAVLMISSPNNPTGNRLLDGDALEALLRALPATAVVVDEAYAEYGGGSFAPLCQRFPNLVVLKTFSKAYGLAGLRVGYVVAHPQVTAELRKLHIPFSVDTLALAAAEAALADQAYLADVVGRVNREVAAFGAALAAIPGLRVHPTDTNFFLVDLQGRWERVGPRLAEQRLLVRRRGDMPEHIRVTCMTADMNPRLLEALASAMA